MSEAHPPSLRGTDRVVFLVGAAVVLAIQLYALWRVPGSGDRSPAGATPTASQAPVARLGTPDPAGILWFTIGADAISPSSAVVRQNEAVEIRLSSSSSQPRVFRLRSESGGQTLQTWAPVNKGAEVGQSLTLPLGTYVLEDGELSAIIEAR